MLLRIAVCDDDVRELEETHNMITEYIKLHDEMDITVRKFQSAYDLLDCTDAGIRFDVYILDILMPHMNGIDVGLEIRKNDENCFIIYLTTSPEFALKSYQVSAYQYLLKPVDKDSLFHELEEIRKREEFESSRRISVKTKEGVHFIPLHRIVFAEYLSHRVVYHLLNDETITGSVSREPFHELIQPLLNDPRFICCHASFVVNMYCIESISQKDFRLTGGQSVPISARCYAHTKKQYLDFLLNEAK